MADEKLIATLDEAEWAWIKPHAGRGVALLVSPTLELLKVGEAMAADDKVRVAEWVRKGLIAPPSLEQCQEWDLAPSRRFLSLVVQPFVLMQELELVH